MTTIPENQLTAWGLKLIKKFKNFTVHLTETPRPYYKDQPVEVPITKISQLKLFRDKIAALFRKCIEHLDTLHGKMHSC